MNTPSSVSAQRMRGDDLVAGGHVAEVGLPPQGWGREEVRAC